jgi:hypothetical protein
MKCRYSEAIHWKELIIQEPQPETRVDLPLLEMKKIVSSNQDTVSDLFHESLAFPLAIDVETPAKAVFELDKLYQHISITLEGAAEELLLKKVTCHILKAFV